MADGFSIRLLDESLTDLSPPLAGFDLTITHRWLRPSRYELSVPDALPSGTLQALLPRANVHGDVVNTAGSTYLVVGSRPYLTMDFPRWQSRTRRWRLVGSDVSMFDHRLVEHFPPGEGYYVTTGAASTRMRAVVQSQVVAPGHPADVVPHLVAPTPAAVGTSGRTEARYQAVSDLLEDIGREGGVGWDVTFDESQFVWAPVPGDDLTDDITIDLDLGTALEMAYEHDQRDAATRVLLAAQGEGVDRYIRAVGGGAGLYRRTMFRDARDVEDSPQRDATLDRRGAEALARTDPGPLMLVEPNTFSDGVRFGEDWGVGDLVTVSNRQLGLAFLARVVEAQVTIRSGLPEVKVAFDRPFPTLEDHRRSEPSFARS